MLRQLPLVFIAIMIQMGVPSRALQSSAGTETLQRRYTDGAVSHYLMTGNNDGWQYTIRATDLVRRDANHRYYEEIHWSDLSTNNHQALTPASLTLRQTVSLDDPVAYMKIPDLASVQPLLIGPITDALTIYSDLLLAMQANLVKAGQTAYVARTTPNSWADGERVLVGQDVVDFSLKVETIQPKEHSEVIIIKHVPPPESHVELTAAWMRGPAGLTPNNFVQVSRQDDGFTGEAGKESFDVRLVVDTSDGHILSATMHNPVDLTICRCTDRALTQCGPAASKTTLREIAWKLVP